MKARKIKCPYCGERAKLTTGDKVYPRIYKLRNRQYYVCSPCDARVGCHRDGRTMGKLANRELRRERINAHEKFDRIWQCGLMTRDAAYQWLCDNMNMTRQRCHIGKFNLAECRAAADLSESYVNQ